MHAGELPVKHGACCNVGYPSECILISNIVKSSWPIINCLVVKSLCKCAQCTAGFMRSMCCVCSDYLHEQPLWRLWRMWSLVTFGCTWAPQVAFILWQGVASDCVSAKTNITLFKVARQARLQTSNVIYHKHIFRLLMILLWRLLWSGQLRGLPSLDDCSILI